MGWRRRSPPHPGARGGAARATGPPPLALAFHELDGHVRVPAAAIVDEHAGPHRSHDVLRGMVPLPGGTRPIVDLRAARAAVHALTGHPDVDADEER